MSRVAMLAVRWCGILVAGLAVCRIADAQPTRRATDRASSAESWLARVPIDSRRAIDFHAAVPVDTVYVNEQVTWQAAVLINARIRDRLRRNPEFVPPALQGVLAYDLGSPRRTSMSATDGTPFEAYLFRRAMFPVSAGTLRIPSPQLSYRLPPTAGYFSREESFVVKAESTTVAVRPLPDEGRPADFSGAVGTYDIATQLESDNARAGDPLLLTVRVRGTGNVALLTRPVVVIPWGTIVAGAERVAIDTTSNVVRGTKEFDFVITPHDTGVLSMPSVTLAYFAPDRAAYVVARSQPQSIRIRPTAVAMVAAPDEGPTSADEGHPLRPWSPDASVPAWRAWHPVWIWIWWALFPGVAVVRMVRRQRRALRPLGATPAPRAVDDDRSPGGEARRLRRRIMQRVADRLEVPVATLIDHAAVRRALRVHGVSREGTGAVIDLLDRLARAGFGDPREAGTHRIVTDDVEALLHRVDAEALPRERSGMRRRWLKGLSLLLALGLGIPFGPPLQAGQSPDVGDATRLAAAQAAQAHGRHDYREAVQLWARAIQYYPRDAVLLANWGESAWQSGDTVTAVMAWHRALRAAPTDQAVRNQLAVLPPGAREGWTMVPAIRPEWLLGIGGLLWAIGWLLVSNRDPRWRSGAVVAIAVGALLALGTRWLAHRMRLEGIAVVNTPTTLRDAPSRDAATAGGIGTGDMVRIRATQDAWHQVELADGRTGWIPAAPAITLLIDPGDR